MGAKAQACPCAQWLGPGSSRHTRRGKPRWAPAPGSGLPPQDCPCPSYRKGHLAFSMVYVNANLFKSKRGAQTDAGRGAGTSLTRSFVSKCRSLVGRILNITLLFTNTSYFNKGRGAKAASYKSAFQTGRAGQTFDKSVSGCWRSKAPRWPALQATLGQPMGAGLRRGGGVSRAEFPGLATQPKRWRASDWARRGPFHALGRDDGASGSYTCSRTKATLRHT